jgi:ribosomal-protein-alanine N-acetyltransferase
MEIRQATAYDSECLEKMDRACFSTPWNQKSWEDSLSMKQYQCLIVKEQREIGFLLTSHAADEGEIIKIGVLPEYRGKKYAAQLLNAAFESWKEKNINSVFLEVRESNHSARRLYEATGFLEVGIRKNYYHNPVEHAIICVKEL